MAMTPASGLVGAPLTLTMSGYGSGETLDIKWYASTSGDATTIASVTASATGSATVTVNVPPTSNGTHKVEVVGNAGSGSAYRFYYVSPSLSLSPASGPAGTSVTATLAGYAPSQTVDIKWYTNSYQSTTVASVVTDALGSAVTAFTVPAGATPGVHKVDGLSATYLRATMNFTVN
jgi:hypothetical protein